MQVCKLNAITRRTSHIFLCSFLSCCCVVSCAQNNSQTKRHDLQSPTLILHSGFEANTTLYNANASILGFQGTDKSVNSQNSWRRDSNFDANIGMIYCQLGSPGVSQDRNVSITNDPLNPMNHVLAFQINKATEPGPPLKGRVSMNIGENKNLKEIYYKVRLMLPSDFEYLKDFTFRPGNWLTIMEFWENPDWTVPAPYPFRVTLYVINSPDHAGLAFGVEAQTMDPNNWQTVWRLTNSNFKLPFNEWLSMEVYYNEGNASTGRFYLAVTRSNSRKEVIFDERNFTYHPLNPSPAGLKFINPMKLYCSSTVVDWVSNHKPRNGILRVYWDDFEFWKNRSP